MLIVFGSINMDIFFEAPRHPVTGETMICSSYTMASGGKGANQALAAARFGGKIALVGRVGDDGLGMRILNVIRREGVMTSGVAQSMFPTGCSSIVRDPHGRLQIAYAPGANRDVDETQVPDEILGSSNFVLMQMETTPEENWKLLERAEKFGARTMLNLAPAITIPEAALRRLDYLIVNELEARQIGALLGFKVEIDAVKLARALSLAGRKLTCIVTLGARGALAVTPAGQMIEVPALEIAEVVDHTGAGDAYCGTLAAALHANLSLREAMRRASVAGALACTKKGAQDSFPLLGQIEEALPRLGETKISTVK